MCSHLIKALKPPRMHRFMVVLVGLFVLAGLFAPLPASSQDGTGKIVVVGTSGKFPPYSMTDAQGRPYGFAIDVMDRVAELAGLNIRYETVSSGAIQALREGRIDVMPSLGISQHRLKDFAFTHPMETFRISLFLRQDTIGINGGAHLTGRKVGTIKTNVAHQLLSNRRDLTLITYGDVPAALFALISGQIDAFAYPEPVAWKIARDAGIEGRLKTAQIPLAEIKRAMAVSKDNTTLLDTLNPAVQAFVASDAYRDIYVKWFGQHASLWTTMRVTLAMAAGFAVLIVAMMIWRYVSIVALNKELAQSIKEREVIAEHLRKALIDAEQANHAKSQFLATMSHEFRTPLNAILGFSEMLRSQYFGPLGAQNYTEYAQDIFASGEHLLSLINDILDISAIEAGMRDLESERVDVNALLADCIKTVQKSADDKNINIRFEMPADFPPLFSDKRSVKQIVLNLLSNAIKFTAESGEILVSARQNDDLSVISIKDTGIGIPPNSLPKVMEPFSRLHDDFTIAQEGTGLGLSIASALAEALGGKLEIVSEVGKGTEAEVRLPTQGKPDF